LIFDGDLETELAKLKNLNGVFFCGGGAGGDYETFGAAVYKKAKEMNNEGNYLPVWGTCLGFENLAMFAAGLSKKEMLTPGYNASDANYELHFL